MSRLAKYLVCGFVSLLLGACASLQELDRSRLNHGAMDFDRSRSHAMETPLTQLNQSQKSAASGGCSVCAH